jgi:hypothetical protein
MTSSSRPISTSTLTFACACYNSGLFDFRKDTVTPSLKIDDKLLSDILSERSLPVLLAALYPPKSPYEFSVIGIEILGEVYEQFLGKVIRLTAGHQAKVEEKPEVRKAGELRLARLASARRHPDVRHAPDPGRPPLTDTELLNMSPELRTPLDTRMRSGRR